MVVVDQVEHWDGVYARNDDMTMCGTTTLFAAFNTADGTVISWLHRRHRTIEFAKFLTKIDS